jgi:hypothetical protein
MILLKEPPTGDPKGLCQESESTKQNLAHNQSDTELARGVTVRDYENARDQNPSNRVYIAELIRKRFTERYIEPARANPAHGFTMMAVACLMIEALESFRQGWDTSKGKSEKAFELFFRHSEQFKDIKAHSKDFYDHIRCGILHQAETRGGWRIRRDQSPLFDHNACTINATRFLEALEQVLDDYCDMLKTADWNNSQWKNARIRLDAIVKNCRN